jgi:PAS domain S-box-containing protein
MKGSRATTTPRARRPPTARRRSAPLPSGEETRRILENLPVAVVVATLEENPRLLFLNQQFIKTFGYTLKDIPTQRDWARRAYPDAAYRREVFREWEAAVARALQKKGSVESMEFRVTARDGRQLDILFNATVLGDTIQISLSDLTARHEAERALQSAREQLEHTAYEVTENIPAGTYTMILRPGEELAHFTFMSSRFLELCGLDRQAAEENPLNAFACVHPDDREEWIRKNAECFEKKIPFAAECRVVAHGVTRWIFAESIPRDLPDGSVVWEGVLSDISIRKLSEQRVAASEAYLRKILDNIPIPVSTSDAVVDGRITFLNEAFTRTFGYTADDLPDVGTWARLAYPDEEYRAATFRLWDEAVAKAARTDGMVPSMEVYVCAKDGTRRDVIISAAAIDHMLLVGFVDVTARRQAEQALDTARKQLEKTAYELTANIPVGTYVLESDTAGHPRFTFTSDRWLTMLDLRREDVLADAALALAAVHPEEREHFLQLNAEVFAQKKPLYWEGRLLVRGETRWVTIESIPRDRPGGGTIWEGVMVDITSRHVAEAELAALRRAEQIKERQERENLEAKLRASLAAAAAAHEINQPLGRILLTSELVLEHEAKASRGNSRVSTFLRSLSAETRQVVNTIEKMKSLMRNTSTAKECVDLRDLADAALLYARSFARPIRAEVTFARPARSALLEADADQIQIALNNLLRNALEAIAEQPARRPRRVRVEVRHRRNNFELVVGDNGPGLPEGTTADRLPESTKPGGTGLGIFIVRTAAKNHGGHLEIGRSPLGGAEVRMILPKPASPW